MIEGFLFEQNESNEVLRQNLFNLNILLSSLNKIAPEIAGINPDQESIFVHQYHFQTPNRNLCKSVQFLSKEILYRPMG